MSESKGEPKLHIDSDWKAEAQREKERLAQKETKDKPKAGAANHQGELPEANFGVLVTMLEPQAIMGVGAMADRETGRVVVDLEGSRFSIDLLDMLEQKTKGNLIEEEAKELRQLLAELRSRFVQISQ